MKLWIVLTWITILPLECIASEHVDLPADVRAQAQERIDEGFHLGTVIGVIDRTGRHFYAFGRTSMTGDTVPDKHSIFEIASVTKGFTAMLVADLEIDGRLDTTAPIGRYVPTLERTNERRCAAHHNRASIDAYRWSSAEPIKH